MSKMGMSVLLLLVSVFISSVSQIILKTSANKKHENVVAEYLNLRVVGAYGMFFLSTILTMIALKRVPLSMSPILEASGYVYVAVMGYFFLNEKFNRKKVAGMVLILLGIAICSFRGVG